MHSRTVEGSLHVGCKPNTENSIPFGSKDYIYEEALLPFWFTHRLLLSCCRKLRLQKRFFWRLSNCEPLLSLLTINPGEISICEGFHVVFYFFFKSRCSTNMLLVICNIPMLPRTEQFADAFLFTLTRLYRVLKTDHSQP